MGFTKHTGVEQAKVLTPAQHEAAQESLHAMGKTSARDLSDAQREQLRVSLDKTR